MQDIRKIHRKADLASNPWSRDIFSEEQTKIKSHAIANPVLAPNHGLELPSAQISVVCKATVNFTPQCQSNTDIVQDREASGINMTAGGLNSQHTCAGVTGEHKTNIAIDPRPVRKGLLRDEIEPVVGQS